MLTPVPPTDCMLARESASVRLDGELSELEAARLDAHLRACADCRAYAEQVGAIAAQLRAAPLEPPAQPFALPRRRVFSGLRLQAAVAAAAVAVAALVAGSSFTLGQALTVHNPPAGGGAGGGDMLSLRADSTQQHLLAMLPELEPVPTARPGQLEAV